MSKLGTKLDKLQNYPITRRASLKLLGYLPILPTQKVMICHLPNYNMTGLYLQLSRYVLWELTRPIFTPPALQHQRPSKAGILPAWGWGHMDCGHRQKIEHGRG